MTYSMDDLTQMLTAAEQRLRAYGIDGCIELTPGRLLSFRKTGAEWGLVVEEDGQRHPLITTGRTTRIQAAAVIPALAKVLAKRRDEMAIDIANAARILHGWLEDQAVRREREDLLTKGQER